jgi:hypothetical protein
MPKIPEQPRGAGFQSDIRLRSRRNEKVYHVFTRGTDVWTEKRRKAEKTYRRLVREKGSSRLYVETDKDRANDVMISENCLKALGAYSLVTSGMRITIN